MKRTSPATRDFVVQSVTTRAAHRILARPMPLVGFALGDADGEHVEGDAPATGQGRATGRPSTGSASVPDLAAAR
ncbi:MAG: hypothetical protein U1F39_01795 [Steroidobacteraceae bacterium]